MNKNIENLALKIFEDEEKIKEILNIYEFDILCDKIKSIEPQINKSEIEEIMKALNENNLSELSQNDLESISGGKSNAGYKIMASVMAMLIGLSPNLAAEGSVAEASGQGENKPITQKVKDWVSNHKILSLGGAGSVFLTGLFVVRNRHSDEDVAVINRHSGKDELLGRLPGLWEKFWNAYDAAGDAARDAAGDAARAAAGAAARAAAWDAARAAAGAAAWDAALVAAWAAARATAWGDAWVAAYHAACADAWAINGSAYNIVRNNNTAYFINLVNVLEEQTRILTAATPNQEATGEITVNQNQNNGDSAQEVNNSQNESEANNQEQTNQENIETNDQVGPAEMNEQKQTKEELLDKLPDLWKNFWNAYDATFANARAAAGDAARDAAGDAAYNAAWAAARDAAAAARDAAAAARDTAWAAAYNAAFANAWAIHGSAYNIVKNNNTEYFMNLVNVLKEQTQKLNNLLEHQQ